MFGVKRHSQPGIVTSCTTSTHQTSPHQGHSRSVCTKLCLSQRGDEMRKIVIDAGPIAAKLIDRDVQQAPRSRISQKTMIGFVLELFDVPAYLDSSKGRWRCGVGVRLQWW